MTDPISGAPAGNDPAATPPADPGATTSDTIVAAEVTTAAEGETWYSGFDTDTVGWLENRGLTKLDTNEALANAVKGFRNAEKYVGVPHEQLVRIPDMEKGDPVEMNQFFDKLGRPSDPKDYELSVPEGQGTEFADWAKGMFHEVGLSAAQGKQLVDRWNAYQAEAGEQSTQQYQESVTADDNALKSEWGQAYDLEMDAAKAGAKALGLQPAEIDALEKILGYGNLMKRMAVVGKKVGEDSFVSGSGNNDGPMTPQAAQAQIALLRADTEWTTKYLNGNVQCKAEMERLHKLAYPSKVS